MKTIKANSTSKMLIWKLTSQELVRIFLLFALCIGVYSGPQLSPSDRLRMSAFPCSCVRELLVILIHLLSWRQKSGHGQVVSLTDISHITSSPLSCITGVLHLHFEKKNMKNELVFLSRGIISRLSCEEAEKSILQL